MNDFLLANWKYLVTIILSIVFLVLSLFNKKTKIVDNSIVAAIVDLTIEAEAKYGPGNGEIKLSYVLAKLYEMYPGTTISTDVYRSIVEHVLSSPHKKED